MLLVYQTLLLLLFKYKIVSDCLATPWTVAHQAPLAMGFSRQGYWTGLPFPAPEDLPDPEMEPESPALAGRFFTAELAGKPRGPYTAWIRHLGLGWVSGHW